MGANVVLGDGQAWSLRRPVIRFSIPEDNEVGFRSALTLEAGDDFQDKVDALAKLWEGEEPPLLSDLASAELAIGRALLLANYDLTPAQLRVLLSFGYNPEIDPDGDAIRRGVLDCTFGRSGPKPPADGEDSSPTLSAESSGATE